MQVSCNTIYDLLPLYVKGICSEESRNIVDEHLEKCSNCKKKLEIMRNDINKNDKTENSLSLSTKLNHIKSSLFCVVFYLFLIFALMICRFFEKRAYQTYNVIYGYSSIAVLMLVFCILGIMITYLGKHQKTQVKINVIEFIVFGAPFIFMCFITFYPFFSFDMLGFSVYEFINMYVKELWIAGSVLFGYDIFILITSRMSLLNLNKKKKAAEA
ncbi:MAG: zf-HC2 domain-containing protein [Eubacteriales bacterium]